MAVPPRPNVPVPTRVAVLRALHLGDMLCAVPALRALRRGLPGAHVALVGLPWACEFASRFRAYVDEFIEFPGYPGLPERTPPIADIPKFLAEMQARRFDIALQLHGSGSVTNAVVALFGAARTAGFYPPEQPSPSDGRFLAYPGEDPERVRLLRLVEFLGCPPDGDRLEFPVTPADREALATIEESSRLGDAYVCVHAGARHPMRRWAPSRFAAVADALAAQGLTVVLTGTRDEQAIARAVADAMDAPAVNLAGRTTLGALAALIERSRLLVCNDTGVSHLADALDVPSVVVFTGSDPGRWAPADMDRHRVLRGVGVDAAAATEQAKALLEQEAVHA